MLSVVLVGAIGWGGWLNVSSQYLNEEFPPGAIYVNQFGVVEAPDNPVFKDGKLVSGTPASDVEVFGDSLVRFASGHKVIAICFHWSGTEDELDVTDLSKSAPFDIHAGTIGIRIPWSSQFIEEVGRGDLKTFYALLLVPNSVLPGNIHSMRDATNRGAHLLQTAAGPP